MRYIEKKYGISKYVLSDYIFLFYSLVLLP